ncbi:hypothetical protein [Bradyrhizobium sp. 191]|uniref:hypothetical protein n=1 Tax=Bradyrhizobium sp. 191 TaxID=2782659 RepID=UPI001FFF0E46|nr:hypothetical protein [Bradyrhizobium sp. 191]UPJ68109.1 hypothetical protein IVB23_12425 [Bradyrhizobium sp. 191]
MMAADHRRGVTLEADGSPSSLLMRVCGALEKSLEVGEVRFARERAEGQPNDYRAVIQFHVGAHLFDWFFNGRRGYRAHFWADYQCGLRFNDQLIDALRSILETRIQDAVVGRELDDRFEDIGAARIARSFLINSLVPYLSKVWLCTKRIRLNGGTEWLPTGVLGPRILLGSDGSSWAAPHRDEDAAWLDIKGAFLGRAGVYQPKTPLERAKKLQATGEA